jgi:lysophospholipase L1-like esterase
MLRSSEPRRACSKPLRTLLLACAMAAVPAAAWADSAHWVAAWASAPQSVSDNPAAPVFNRAPQVYHQTIRQIVYPGLSGDRVRIQLSNRDGRVPLAVAEVHLARSASLAATERGSDRQLTFAGKSSLVIPPGQTWQSDPVALTVTGGAPLAVSLYIDGAETPSTWHKVASQVNYMSIPGNHAADAGGAAFHSRFTSYIWLSGVSVDVGEHSDAFAVAAIGDSITDGMRSTLNANRRWPDALARRIANPRVAVLNLGISGNRLLNNSPCYGPSLASRFKADALTQAGVRVAVILVGINDINFSAEPPHPGLDCDVPHTKVTDAALIAGYRTLIAAAHAQGVRIVGATLTPAALPPEREATRLAVNRWIRGGGGFDGVIDFDAALRNPARPGELLPRFDSGDHIHPSDAGYAQMAEQIPLKLLGLP